MTQGCCALSDTACVVSPLHHKNTHHKLQRGYKVRALTRKPEKTQQLFNNHPNLEVRAHCVCVLGQQTRQCIVQSLTHSPPAVFLLCSVDVLLSFLFVCRVRLQVATADLRDASSLASVVSGVDAVCCCTGTTAFPSNRCAFYG